MSRYLVTVVALLFVGTAQASLVGRDINGNPVAGSDASAVFLYDDVLNVTWLRDANVNGSMTWSDANTWASTLTVGSYSGWRLPTMIDTGSAGCNTANSGTDCGYNVQTKTGNHTQYQAGQTVYSEMASLFYDTLGNKALLSTSGASQTGYGIVNPGDFQNMQSNFYWSGLSYSPDSTLAWDFDTAEGSQYNDSKTWTLYAMAVRPGDVLAPAAVVAPAAVPVPASLPLLLSGIAALGVAGRRQVRRRLGA